MKKLLSAIFSLSLVFILSFSLVGCGNSAGIQYGKKYYYGSEVYYFSSDGTGYYERHETKDGYTYSGRVDYFWETASDGMVYLFHKETKLYNDNTSPYGVSLINYPLSFGKDFFAYTYYTYAYSAGGLTYQGVRRFVVEGSKLDKNANK